MRIFHPQSYTTLLARGYMNSRHKIKTSPLTQCLSPPYLAGLLHLIRGFPHEVKIPIDYVTN